jgi:hypothetical protein
MRKNYFAKLMNYMKNVYNIDRLFNKLEDTRVNPKYKTGHALMPLLLGLLLRIKSMNELKFMLKEKEFASAFPRGKKLAQVDTIRDTLKVISINGLKVILHSVVATAVKNKTFTNGTIDGYTVAAIDGTKFFGSNKKSCPECLTSKEHHYHSGVVMSTIGDKPRLVLGFEMMRPDQDSTNKDEGEMTAAKRLITDIRSSYPKFIDVVVYDALACNSKWINHCLDMKMDFIVRAKKNNINGIKAIKKAVNKLDPVIIWGKDKEFEYVKVSESTFQMDKVDRPLRFVKFEMKRLNGRYNQILIVTSCMDMPLESLFKMIRGRWDIENSIFNNLKSECGLEHCFVHGGHAVEAVLCLIFIAANIMQLFLNRRLKIRGKTQKELIRLLLMGLYLLKYRKELVFSSA